MISQEIIRKDVCHRLPSHHLCITNTFVFHYAHALYIHYISGGHSEVFKRPLSAFNTTMTANNGNRRYVTIFKANNLVVFTSNKQETGAVCFVDFNCFIVTLGYCLHEKRHSERLYKYYFEISSSFTRDHYLFQLQKRSQHSENSYSRYLGDEPPWLASSNYW